MKNPLRDWDDSIELEDLLDGPISCQGLARCAMMMLVLYDRSDVVVRQITFGRELADAWCKLLNEQAERDNVVDGKPVYVEPAFLRPEGVHPLVELTPAGKALADKLATAAGFEL